jgi:hypothetical protein
MNKKLVRVAAVGLITTLAASTVWAVGPMAAVGPMGGVPMGSVQVEQPK